MDWLCSGRRDSFRYVLVDRDSMTEVCELDMFVDGGSLEYNDLTSIKVAGALPYIEPPNIGFNYLRVYSTSYLNGEMVELLHGTFLLATPTFDIKGRMRVGEAKIFSVLQVLVQAATNVPYSIPEGTNAIARAREIIEAQGLLVVADPSNAALSTVANFEAGTSWLEIVNYLCGVAGFNSANVDAIGSVRLTFYTDPAEREPSIEFIDDERCHFNPLMRYEFDIFEVPNVVTMVMSNEEQVMTATVRNDDPLSIFSTVSRGREITFVETVSDIDNYDALKNLAARRLAEKSSGVESIEVEHSFIPYLPGEVGRFNYSQAGFEFSGAAAKKSVKLITGMPCVARFRRFVRLVAAA